jgi:hypothetical protein
MGAPAVVMAEDVIEVTMPGDAPPRTWQEELRLLAFEIWRRGSLPETDTDQDWLEAEAWRHASLM